jgi:mono/diheme cytochrome c family protein
LKTPKFIRHFSLAIGGFILLVAFNNCDKGFMMLDTPGEGAFASGSDCEASLMKIYENTYHGFLSQTCNNCHIVGPGIGKFASPNVTTSYASFVSIGADKINSQAVNEAHKPPYTGSQNISSINSYKATWADAQISYAACLASGGTGGSTGSISEFTVRSDNKKVSATLATTFVRMEWDLQTESSSKVPLVAGIEIRKAVLNNVTQGYEFRNPTLRLKNTTSGDYYARALNIYINGQLQGNTTTYSNIEATINSMTNINVATGYANAWAVYTVATTDTIAMEFSTLKSTTGAPNPGTTPTPAPTVMPSPSPSPTASPSPTTPPTVTTFTQLVANGGIFANSCISCHSNNGAAGGLNLQNYTQAKNAAANIKSRMNNANNPMPTGGLLNQTQRSVVDAWVDAGAPQ